MKKLRVLLKSVLILGFLLISKTCFPQTQFTLSVGTGLPDNLNLKMKYGNQVQVGLSLGYDALFNFPEPNSHLGPVSGEIYYYFGGNSKFTDQRPWYVMGGVGYWLITQKGLILYPRIGRNINLSAKVGITLDGGMFIPIGKELVDFWWGSTVLVSGNIGFFIRF